MYRKIQWLWQLLDRDTDRKVERGRQRGLTEAYRGTDRTEKAIGCGMVEAVSGRRAVGEGKGRDGKGGRPDNYGCSRKG